MREINNNNVDIGKIPNIKIEKADSHDAQLNDAQMPDDLLEQNVGDFSNPSAEALGRSQVCKADNLKSDVDFAKANPDAVELSDKLFDMALKKLQSEGDPQAYEKACAISTSEDAKALFSK